eukprot:4304180-Pleurochrysis_carterae.AAC.2
MCELLLPENNKWVLHSCLPTASAEQRGTGSVPSSPYNGEKHACFGMRPTLTIFATQIFARCLPIMASHVLHVPSWQSYLIGMPVERAMSFRLCPGTTIDFFVWPVGDFHVTSRLVFSLLSPAFDALPNVSSFANALLKASKSPIEGAYARWKTGVVEPKCRTGGSTSAEAAEQSSASAPNNLIVPAIALAVAEAQAATRCWADRARRLELDLVTFTLVSFDVNVGLETTNDF